MKQKRKFPRWIVVLTVGVLVCAGVKVWYDRLCHGEIDISASAPSKEMLLHIIEHADELAAREDLFDVSTNEYGHTTINYLGNENFLYANFMYSPESMQDIANSYTTEFVTGRYHRYEHSDFWDIVTPWSECHMTFAIAPQPVSYFLLLEVENVTEISDAPLREMMSAIESVIGTP